MPKESTTFWTNRGVRCYRLTKKMPDGTVHIASNFTMRVKRNGRIVYFALPSTKKDAADEANKIDRFLELRTNTLDMAIQRFDPDRWERLHPTAKIATVGDILAAHKAAEKALGLEEVTAKDYRNNLVLTFRQALAHRKKKKPSEIPEETIHAMSIGEFTHRLVSDFKIARVSLAGDDKAAQEVKKRSVNAVARSVASLFGKEARKYYSHLTLPADLDNVLESMPYAKTAKTKYRLPSVSVIMDVYNGAGDLRALENKNDYLAFLLAGHAGLRKNEIAEAVVEWIEDVPGGLPRMWVKATPTFKPKAKDEGWAEIAPWVADEIRVFSPKSGLILQDKDEKSHERTVAVFKRLNAWLEAKKLLSGKGARRVHELRKLFGSYIANTRGIYKAQKMLRHSTPQITSDTYADVHLDDALKDIWEKRPAWATGIK